jgi:hypothetical protein
MVPQSHRCEYPSQRELACYWVKFEVKLSDFKDSEMSISSRFKPKNRSLTSSSQSRYKRVNRRGIIVVRCEWMRISKYSSNTYAALMRIEAHPAMNRRATGTAPHEWGFLSW